MEIDNEVPDPPSMENISEENAFEPISVAVDEIAFDNCMLHDSCNMSHSVYILYRFLTTFSALRDEYDRGDGDLEIICDGDNRIVCHSCIVECQSRIMRRSIVRKSQDGLLLPRAQLRYFKKSIIYLNFIIFLKLSEILNISNAKVVRNYVSQSTCSFQFTQRND